VTGRDKKEVGMMLLQRVLVEIDVDVAVGDVEEDNKDVVDIAVVADDAGSYYYREH